MKETEKKEGGRRMDRRREMNSGEEDVLKKGNLTDGWQDFKVQFRFCLFASLPSNKRSHGVMQPPLFIKSSEVLHGQ